MAELRTSIIVFDVETTGIDKERDQIIELSVQQGLDDGSPNRTWRVKPSVPISPGAKRVHGITMPDLRDCPSFPAVAGEIRPFFHTADVLVGTTSTSIWKCCRPSFDVTGSRPLT